MSQQIREQLSALMDGELSRDETAFLLRRMGHDQDLVACWSSFHVSRQVLRRQDVLALQDGFVESILSRIENEPMPQAVQSGRWLRWVSGGAIAASVAVVALVFSGGPRNGGVESAGEPLASAPATSVPTATVPAARATEFRPPLVSPALDVQPASISSEGFATPAAPLDPRLQSYLVRHYDAAGNGGQSGLMPYVLLIVPTQPQAAETATAEAADKR